MAARGTGLTFREPLGVCALITPWNFPLLITSWKVAPALAMGNTVVIKPAQATPLSALALAEVRLEPVCRRGCVNVLPGTGTVAGRQLALVAAPDGAQDSRSPARPRSAPDHEGVRRRHQTRFAGARRQVGERGRLADTDLDACVESSIWAVFDNAGQDCCARSRMFVERPLFDRFVDRFVERTRAIRVGPTSSTRDRDGSR